MARRCHGCVWRITSVNKAKPVRSVMARNAAPASMGCSCSGSPTRTIFAPADFAAARKAASCGDATMPASSRTNTSPGRRVSRPCFQASCQLASVRDGMPDDPCNASAALPASAPPMTRRPFAIQAALAAASMVDLPVPATPIAEAMSPTAVTSWTASTCSVESLKPAEASMSAIARSTSPCGTAGLALVMSNSVSSAIARSSLTSVCVE